MTSEIRFDNGATYERFMGRWSQLIGEQFLNWVGVGNGLHWLDVGCGNGAFTELIVAGKSPNGVHGIDPSAEQLAFARMRPALSNVDFREGDAMALPFDDNSFDVAVMPLVIHFVPEPARGVSEMARVVREGGTVAAYVWDMEGGGFPYSVLQREMREREMTVPVPSREDSSGIATLEKLWGDAGLDRIETTAITASRTFADFDDYWTSVRGGPSVGRTLKQLAAGSATELQKRMRELLPTDSEGRITYSATAHAVRGNVKQG